MDLGLLGKYKDMEFKSDGTLFGADLLLSVTKKVCPFCFNKLYEMRGKPFWYCKSRKHKNKFIIGKDKMK